MPLDPIELVGGLAVGEGLGGAIADTVVPRLQDFKNKQWAAHQDVPLDAASAAEVAAEDVAKYGAMETEAGLTGYDVDRFADLYGVALNAPGTGLLLELLRRDDEQGIDFAHGLRKARLEPQWDAALRNLRDVRIPAPDLAYMVVRDLVPNPFAGSGPTGPGDDAIVDIPQLQIDTLVEAAKTGWDAQRFEALVGRSGLAPAPILAANAFFRKIITWDQYRTIIAKGDLRPAYTNVILNAARQILTAGEYSEAELRGYSTTVERLANTAKHGMSEADSNLLHLIQGRPLAVHQVTTGLARGGAFGGLYSDVPEPYQAAIRQSNIKEPWAGLAYANRYSLPSAFVLRALLQAGVLSAAEGETYFLHIGWPPQLAKQVADFYGKTTAGTGDPHVTKAENQLWTALHGSYVKDRTDDATATTTLGTLGVQASAIPQVLTLWQAEREIVRAGLSAAQIKKAYQEATFTQPEAVARLQELGWSVADANVYLGE